MGLGAAGARDSGCHKGTAPDWIAAFANTGGLGCHEQRKIFEDKGEIDKAILLEAIADRLAEAFAEVIHLKIRTTLWGYAPDEKLSLDDLLKVCRDPRRLANFIGATSTMSRRPIGDKAAAADSSIRPRAPPIADPSLILLDGQPSI